MLTHLGAQATAKKLEGVLSWPRLLFAERVVEVRRPTQERVLLNLSDPEVMAAAAARLLGALGVATVLASPPVDTTVEIDGTGAKREYDSRRDWPGLDDAMGLRLPPDLRAALRELFREAGFRKGFYGAVVAHGTDCSRVARLLVGYSRGLWEDIVFLSEQPRLALVACHEGDLHVYAPEASVLATCRQALRQAGLKVVPAEREFQRADPEWYRAGLVAYGARTLLPLLEGGLEPAEVPEARLRRPLARAAHDLVDPSSPHRAFAAYLLSTLGGEGEVRLAVEALRDRDLLVRLAAAKGLGGASRQVAVSALERALREDPDADVRGEVAAALELLIAPSARRTLLFAAESDPDAGVREAALQALTAAAPARALPSLARRVAAILTEDPSSGVRDEAATALGAYGGSAAVPALGAAFPGERSWLVRAQIVDALAPLRSRAALPVLAQALTDPEWVVREGAVEALRALPLRTAAPLLRRALEDQHPKVRAAAARTLGLRSSPAPAE